MLLRCAAKQSRAVRCEIAFLLLHGKLTTARRGVCFSGCSCAAVCSLPQEVGREAVERVVSARLLVGAVTVAVYLPAVSGSALASAARPALEPSASAVLFDSSASRLLADFSSPASSTIARNPLRVAQRDARKATEPAVPDTGRLRLFARRSGRQRRRERPQRAPVRPSPHRLRRGPRTLTRAPSERERVGNAPHRPMYRRKACSLPGRSSRRRIQHRASCVTRTWPAARRLCP